MNAYNELYLDDAMANLGDMVEYAVCTLGYAPDDFFGWFISSGIASKFENGNPKYVAGMLGVELADAVLAAVNMQSERHHQPHLSSKGREYWAGWILAYYQWETNRRFSDMVEYGLTLSVVMSLYILHEADVSKFVESADEIIQRNKGSWIIRKETPDASLSCCCVSPLAFRVSCSLDLQLPLFLANDPDLRTEAVRTCKSAGRYCA